MATLASATKETRLLLKYLGIFLIVVIAGVLIYQLSIFIKERYLTKPIPPEEGFGELLRLDFISENIPPYHLNTFTGDLPIFPDRIKVIKMDQPQINLLTLENVKRKLRGFGYSENEVKISDVMYEWTNVSDPSSKISYNILWDDFDIKSDYTKDSTITQTPSILTNNLANRTVFDFLSKLIDDSDLLDPDKSTFTYYKLADGIVIPTDGKTNVQLIRVNLFYKVIDGMEAFFSNLRDSEMSFLVANNKDMPKIVEAHFNHRKIDLNLFSTYPIKSSLEAYQDLISGKAKRFDLDKTNDSEILQVYLSYYITENKPSYLLPIVVFQGKNFYAFTEALSSSSTTSSAYLRNQN